MTMTLEFLIPSYRRISTAFDAAESVFRQFGQIANDVSVGVWIQDDCSPGVSLNMLRAEAAARGLDIKITQNSVNVGMSANIFSMSRQSTADFCTVLTDDDRLQDNALASICLSMKTAVSRRSDIGSFFVPRFSYLEDGTLHCIACKPFDCDELIKPSPEAAIKYCYHGFVLTGLFFRPSLIDYDLWLDNIENAFFPVIYFGGLLLKHSCWFLNRNWFVHTVLNKCHWERWGSTEAEQLERLFKDYLEALWRVGKYSGAQAAGLVEKGRLAIALEGQYFNQISAMAPRLGPSHLRAIPRYLWHCPEFFLAYLRFRGTQARKTNRRRLLAQRLRVNSFIHN